MTLSVPETALSLKLQLLTPLAYQNLLFFCCMHAITLKKMRSFNLTGTTCPWNPPSYPIRSFHLPSLHSVASLDSVTRHTSSSLDPLTFYHTHLVKPWINEPSPFSTSALSLLSSVRKPLTCSQHSLVVLVYLLTWSSHSQNYFLHSPQTSKLSHLEPSLSANGLIS